MRCVLLCALAAFLAAAPVRAQYPVLADSSVASPVLEPATDEDANQADDPNRVPYETDSNVGHHILAFPATLWSGLASVFREGVLWAEYSGKIERVQARYIGPDPPRYGFSPEFNVGGRDGVTLGGSVFHNNVFGTGRYARVGGRYGFSGTYSIHGRFRDPGLFGSGLRLGLNGSYVNDTQENFFFGGNEAPAEERFEYAFRRALAHAHMTLPVVHPLSIDVEGDYKFMRVRDGDGEPFPEESIPGFGTAHLVSGGANLVLDLSERAGLHAQREYQGTIVLLSYHYGQDVSDRNFAFHRVAGEVRQFIPVPFLPYDRRLALRARYEKTHPPNGKVVPFYEASTLGGVHTLRAYQYARFRDEGYVLFNAEYRWPVWDVLDGVVFFDTGQVFQRYDEVALDAFHSNVGAGLRVYGREGVAGRLEAAYGEDGLRILAQIGTVF